MDILSARESSALMCTASRAVLVAFSYTLHDMGQAIEQELGLRHMQPVDAGAESGETLVATC